MWWILVSCLLTFNGHISSQPLEVKDNVRQTRQLDFGECCPCPGSVQAGQGFEAPGHSLSSFEGPYSRARDVDDCPCRGRSSDSEGAPSVFFPTAVRPDGHVVRPTETKEDPKPLLHPEVDLASSVLETLREATDEEYKEALARDAARSMGRSADEVLFGDTVPDASTSNLVTIIMNPKHSEGLDNVVPEESRVQETRCVHGPLGSARSSPVQPRTATKPPSLLRELFGLPQVDQLEDMDNGVGASNIQERVVEVGGDQAPSKTKIGLRKYAPVLRPDISRNDIPTNLESNLEEVGFGSKVPNLKLPKTTLTELLNQRLLEDKEKIISLPSIPKLKLNNSLLKPVPDLIEDMSVSPSDIQEQAKRNFFEAKSHLDNILQKANTGPLSLKNLLKLKDVEFVPLKDMVKTPPLAIPKLNLPGIFDKGQNDASIEEQTPVNLIKSTGPIGKLSMPSRNEMQDAEVSPSNMIEEVSDNNCNEESSKSAEVANGVTNTDGTDSRHEGEISNEIIDSASSPDTQSEVIEFSNNNADMESNESTQTTDDCNTNAPLMTESPFQPSDRSFVEEDTVGDNRDEMVSDNSEERSIDDITQEDSEPNTVANDENCTDGVNDMDSLTDSSNNINSVVKPDDFEFNQDGTSDNNNVLTEEPCSEEQSFIENVKPPGAGQPTKLIRPLTLDKAISSIKENLKNRFENIKNTAPIPKKAKNFEKRIPNNIEEEERLPTVMDNQQDSTCQEEESLQVTTPKAVICGKKPTVNDDFANKVSMQDLQKISDSMLQREEQERASKADCNGLSSLEMEPKMSTEENSEENQKDSEISANTQKIVIMDPRKIVDTGDRNADDSKNSCKSELASPEQTKEVDDASGSASEVVASVLPQNNVVRPLLSLDKVVQPKLDILNIPVPDLKDLIKIEPIPTLDEIKTGLDNLLGSTGGKAKEQSRAAVTSRITTPNVLSKTMSSDASTKSFRSRLPPLGLEDINLDILQLKPQPNLLKKLPKLELPTKNKLLLPDLEIKPLKLQSTLNDKGLLAGRKNPLDIFPTLETPGSRMKTLSSKTVKTSRKPDVLRSSLTPTKGIEELTDDLESHAKHTLRHMQKTLQSTLRPSKIPTKLQSNDLLEAIARNHEDVSDKLKALHMDFNDRLETMRNNIFDSSLFESHTPEPFSSLSSKTKERKSSLRTAQPKSLTSRLESKKPKPRTQKHGGLRLSSQTNENKFRMPAAASITVPKTLKVPTLKPIIPEPQGVIKQKPITIPTIRNDISKVKALSPSSWRKESEKLNTNTKLTKTMNPFKDSKFEVTFSTTPRPSMPRAQYRKLSLPSSLSDRNMRRFGASDNNGSPSNMRSSVISSPISSQDYELGNKAVDSENGPESFTRLQKVTGKGGRLANSQPKISSNLESWPKASESAFLSKVKEAVNARLSKGPVLKKSGDINISNTDIDMSHAASENVGVVENKVLKENVSYKCTMVCTKE